MPNEEEPKEVVKKSKTLLIIALVLVALLCAGGAGVYLKLINLKSLHLPFMDSGNADHTPAFYPMNTFLVNLADPGSKRFLKVRMELRVSSRACAAECKAIDFELRDLVLTILSSQETYNIVTPREKAALKKEIMASINHVLTKGRVIDIYFTNFLIQ